METERAPRRERLGPRPHMVVQGDFVRKIGTNYRGVEIRWPQAWRMRTMRWPVRLRVTRWPQTEDRDGHVVLGQLGLGPIVCTRYQVAKAVADAIDDGNSLFRAGDTAYVEFFVRSREPGDPYFGPEPDRPWY